MNYQSFFCIFFLFILTINYSLTLSYFDQTNDISEDKLDQSDEISAEYDNHHKWRRQSEFASTRRNLIKKNKRKIHFLKYDFLLHQWILRNIEN